MRMPGSARSRVVAGVAVGLCAAVVAVLVFHRTAVMSTVVPVDIDRYPARTTVLGCAKPLVGKPGVVDFQRLVLSQVGGADAGLEACKKIANDSGDYSDHADGRAWDWYVRASRQADRAKVDLVLDWLLRTDERGQRDAMARRLGITYIIWNQRIYRVAGDDPGWRPYTSTSDPHDTHVHFSFSVAGATRQTSWWRERGPLTWSLAGAPDAPLVFGAYPDRPLVGDWDGDGRDLPGWYNPVDRRFSVRVAGTAGYRTATTPSLGPFGAIPVVGDRDGDGRDEVGVYEPLTRRFSFYTLRGAPVGTPQVFGAAGDVPIVGDWDGDGRDDVGTYTPSSRTFSMLAPGGSVHTRVFGRASDTPLAGDWNGDGRDDIGVFRWPTATFQLAVGSLVHRDRAVPPAGRVTARWLPVAGDWDGNGVDTPGVVGSGTLPDRSEHPYPAHR